LRKENKRYFFTDLGLQKGKRLTKLHRLWELYLTERLRIAPDHVHEDAENIEHILTPELEAKLEKLLQYPKQDPHQRDIPY
jgi:manganese/zinc/iron transport system permease protein